MQSYVVLYKLETHRPLDLPEAFLCEAEDIEDAEGQCEKALPDARVMWVVDGTAEKEALDKWEIRDVDYQQYGYILESNMKLIFADACGVYIPQYFADDYGESAYIEGLTDEDRTYLLDGPDQEYYWDVWERVLNEATVNGWNLYQEGDLWFVNNRAIEEACTDHAIDVTQLWETFQC